MKNWEKALYKFLEKYQDKPYFEGALLCGSYSTGNQNKFSDVDVHIVISDSQNWRERGNKIVDGILIEYFINPIKQIRNEFKGDLQRGRTSCSNMFSYGKILFDKKGCIRQLQKEACKFFKKPMPKYKVSDLAFDFYGIWDLMDELNSLSKEKKSIGLIYNRLLENLMILYFKGKQIPKISLAKIEKILDNPNFAKRYHIQKLPDKKFSKLFLDALKTQNLKNIQSLYDFVVKSLGGFDISKFKLRGKLEN